MFAGDSQTLHNKRHFVISLIAINEFYCTCNCEDLTESNWKRAAETVSNRFIRCGALDIQVCRVQDLPASVITDLLVR